MKLADLGDFNLLNGVSTIGAVALADGLSGILSPSSAINLIQRTEYLKKIGSGALALFLGTHFSISINDFPAMVRPLLQRNLQVILSCGGTGAVILGLKNALSCSEMDVKKGLALISVGAAALTTRLRA